MGADFAALAPLMAIVTGPGDPSLFHFPMRVVIRHDVVWGVEEVKRGCGVGPGGEARQRSALRVRVGVLVGGDLS